MTCSDLAQSNSILRHLGRVYGLYGATLEDAARLDCINDFIEDIRVTYINLYDLMHSGNTASLHMQHLLRLGHQARVHRVHPGQACSSGGVMMMQPRAVCRMMLMLVAEADAGPHIYCWRQGAMTSYATTKIHVRAAQLCGLQRVPGAGLPGDARRRMPGLFACAGSIPRGLPPP